MKPYLDLTIRGKGRRLRKLVDKALTHYDLDVTRIRSLTNEMNGIFRLDTTTGQSYVMRVGLPDSGHGETHVNIEMDWLNTLRHNTDIQVPIPVKTRDGQWVITVEDAGVPQPRHCCIYSWVYGKMIADRRSPETWTRLGELSAKLHQAGVNPTQRQIQNLPIYDSVFPFKDDCVLFDAAHQHHFTEHQRQQSEMAYHKVAAEIDTLYQNRDQARLLHGDLHQWNVLINRSTITPIDFEDIMIAFPIQDIGVTLYYNRFDEHYDDLLAGFKRGYETVAPFPERYAGELETHMLIRRLSLLNFILYAEELDMKDFPNFIPITMERIQYLQDHVW